MKLSNLILSGDYVPQKSQRILVEKSKGLCRQLVIPSVRDALVLQCLSDALYKTIRGKSPTDRSFFEPQEHRFSSDRAEYGTLAAWLNFQHELFEFSKSRNYVVVTDIANYYDSISYVHLRNSISSIAGADECIIDMLIFVLSDLLWQPDYTPRIEIGLPQINLDAPRLLAHCFLYELDAYLASDTSRDFVRFMDDIDIGVDTLADAKKVLKSIDLVLQTKQVRLNSGKTLILSQQKARHHFRVIENSRIDAIKASIKHRKTYGISLLPLRALIERRTQQGLSRKLFDAGNGEKVLKRWLGAAAEVDAYVSPSNLEKIIKFRPAVRDNALSFIRSKPLKPSTSEALANAAISGQLVDDAAGVAIANCLTETLVKRRNCQKYIDTIIESNDASTYYGFYCKLWLQSKYGTPSQIFKTIYEFRSVWFSHDRLGRLVAALTPLFTLTPEEPDYKNLIFSALNDGVRETYKFHINLQNDRSTFAEMYPSLRSPNPSRVTGITHSKFLLLTSALQNKLASASSLLTLKNNHNSLQMDYYYKNIMKRLRL